MMYYHPKKEAAQLVADALARENPTIAAVKVELVENNGWVVVIFPTVADLTHLGEVCEVRHPAGNRLTLPPHNKVKPSSLAPKVAAVPGAPAEPRKIGATGMVWTIADAMVAAGEYKSKADRPKLIAACVAQGINAATASTQYSRWGKARAI